MEDVVIGKLDYAQPDKKSTPVSVDLSGSGIRMIYK